jgi:hypothetical protein
MAVGALQDWGAEAALRAGRDRRIRLPEVPSLGHLDEEIMRLPEKAMLRL